MKLKANNTATMYLEITMTQHNVTTWPIFWAPQKSLCALYAPTPDRRVIFGGLSITCTSPDLLQPPLVTDQRHC